MCKHPLFIGKSLLQGEHHKYIIAVTKPPTVAPVGSDHSIIYQYLLGMGPGSLQDQGWWCKEDSSWSAGEHSVSACVGKKVASGCKPPMNVTVTVTNYVRNFYLNKSSFSRSGHTQAQNTSRTFWYRHSNVIPRSRSSCRTRFHTLCHLSSTHVGVAGQISPAPYHTPSLVKPLYHAHQNCACTLFGEERPTCKDVRKFIAHTCIVLALVWVPKWTMNMVPKNGKPAHEETTAQHWHALLTSDRGSVSQ